MRLMICVASVVALGLGGSAQAQPFEELAFEAQPGSFGYEILGASAVAGLGATAAHFVLRMPELRCESSGEPFSCFSEGTSALGAVVLFEAITPALSASAAALARKLSGGEGRLGPSVLIAYGGAGLGLLIGLGASQRAPADSPLDGFDSRVVLPLSAAGMAGYRFSAHASRRLVWRPTVARNAVALDVSVIL